MKVTVKKTAMKFRINKTATTLIFLLFASTPIRSENEVGFSKKTFGKTTNTKLFMPEELDYSGMLKITGGDCPNSLNDIFGKNFTNNFSVLNAPVKQMQCNIQVPSTNKNLTPEICLSYANCFKYKMTLNPQEAIAIKIAATNHVAEEAVALFAKTGINQMMDFETLRLYSKAKYGKTFLPVACQQIETFKIPEFLPEINDVKCNKEIVEKGFDLFQSTCRIPDLNCFNDYNNFKNQKNTEDPTKARTTSDFLVEKSYDNLTEIFAADTKTLYQISQIMVDESLPIDKRALKIKSFMKDNYFKLDPVFRNYYDREVKYKSDKKSDIFTESLVKYMSSNKNKSSPEVLADLENLRMSEAKSMLEDQCENAANMGNLCTVAGSVKGGAEVQVEAADFFNLVSRKDNYNASRSPIYTLANNVARCNTFVLTNIKGIQNVKAISLSSDLNLLSTSDQFGGNAFGLLAEADTKRGKLILNPDGSIVRTYKNLERYSEPVSKAPPKKNNELILVKNFSKNISMPEVYTKEIAARNNNIQIRDFDKKELTPISSVQPKSNFEPVSNVAKIDNNAPLKIAPQNPNNNTIFPDLLPSMPIQAYPKMEEPTNKMAAKSFNDFTEMTDKLSNLESRLAKVKKQESDLQKTNNSPTDDEKEDDSFEESATNLSTNQKEIKAAQKALKELKENQDIIEQPTVQKNSTNTGESFEAKIANTEARAPRSQSETGSSSGSAAATGNAPAVYSNPVTQNTTYTSASINKFSPPEAVVLLKIEGASSIENKERMNDLISEGKAFYIEENGTIKQIIPELQNGKLKLDKSGKPVYKTVIKGKVGDFQIAKTGTELESKFFDSPADLKKGDDNISRPLIRYQEFRRVLQNPKR